MKTEHLPLSDLIVTPQGKPYHLDILPENLAPTVITVGDPARVPSVSKLFDCIEFTHEHREFVTHTGSLNDKRISVISTGMGTQNIDIFMNELDALVNVDLVSKEVKQEKTSLNIIRLGTSGSIHPNAPLSSLLISKYAVDLTGVTAYYDIESNHAENAILHHFESYIAAAIPKSSIRVHSASDFLMEKFSAHQQYIQGITLTCNGFYAPQFRQLRISTNSRSMLSQIGKYNEHYNDMPITNLEMETAALYGFSKALGHQCLSINAIVADRLEGTFAEDVKLLEKKMIELSLKLITQ